MYRNEKDQNFSDTPSMVVEQRVVKQKSFRHGVQSVGLLSGSLTEESIRVLLRTSVRTFGPQRDAPALRHRTAAGYRSCRFSAPGG